MNEKICNNDKNFKRMFKIRLEQLMEEHQTKPADLSVKLNISPSTLSKYLNQEDKGPSAYLAARIAQYFNVSLQWMGGLSEKRELIQEPNIPQQYDLLSHSGQAYINEMIIDFYNYEKTPSSSLQAADKSMVYKTE